MADITLNIYEKKEVVKTYTCEECFIEFGVVEDIVNMLDLESIDIQDNNSLLELAKRVAMDGIDIIRPLLKDTFDGLTDEELRHTRIDEVNDVIVQIAKFAGTNIMKGFSDEKN